MMLSSLPVSAAAMDSEIVLKKQQCLTPSAVEFQNSIRKLWLEHVIWTRNFIVSAAADMADQEHVLARLLQNQDDLGNALKPLYGEAAGEQMSKLLREHIVMAGQILAAAKAGNNAEVEKLKEAWYRNADEIVNLFVSLIPTLSKKEMTELYRVHLEQVFTAAVARLNKDWATSIKVFDEGENHIIVLADTISSGIIKHHPEKFK